MVLGLNVSDLIIFTVSFIVLTLCVTDAIRIRLKLRNLAAENFQLETNQAIIVMQLDKMVNEQEHKSVEQTEGFLRFISDSRDWAFQYIEDVQVALNEYDAALHSKNAVEINDAYKKLIDFLPKSEDMVN